jgi:hypothetical protein
MFKDPIAFFKFYSLWMNFNQSFDWIATHYAYHIIDILVIYILCNYLKLDYLRALYFGA